MWQNKTNQVNKRSPWGQDLVSLLEKTCWYFDDNTASLARPLQIYWLAIVNLNFLSNIRCFERLYFRQKFMLTIAKIWKQLDGHSGAGPQTNKSNFKPVNILWRREEGSCTTNYLESNYISVKWIWRRPDYNGQCSKVFP